MIIMQCNEKKSKLQSECWLLLGTQSSSFVEKQFALMLITLMSKLSVSDLPSLHSRVENKLQTIMQKCSEMRNNDQLKLEATKLSCLC